MKPIKLTAKQIKELREINRGKSSVKETLRIAMAYHSDNVENYDKKEEEWWKDILDANDIGMSDYVLTADLKAGEIRLKDDE